MTHLQPAAHLPSDELKHSPSISGGPIERGEEGSVGEGRHSEREACPKGNRPKSRTFVFTNPEERNKKSRKVLNKQKKEEN